MSETGLGTSLKRLTHSEGDWVLEVERLVPFGRHLHQPVQQKIEGASLIGRHLRAVPELSEMAELTERLMNGEAPAEAYELWKGEWLDVEMVRILSLANARAADVVRSGGQAEGGASRKAVAVLERSQSKLEERLEALEQGGEQFEKMAALIESLTEKVSALEAKLGMDPAEAEAFAAEAKAKAKAQEPSANKSYSDSPPGASSLKSDDVSESAAAPASADDEKSASESAAAAASADDEKSASAAAPASADDASSASAAAPDAAAAPADDDSSAPDAAASSNDDSSDDENSASEAADTAEAADDESGEASVEDAGGTAQEKPQRPAKRMRPPTKTAMRQSLETLVGEEIALKERSKHVDFTDGTFFRAELHDDDGLLVGTMIADVEATVKLACMLMMLPEDEVQEQLAANEASEDSVETMSEIFNTMSATINNVKSNPHVRTTPLAPLNPQEFEWVKTTKRRIDVDVGCGGVISICAV